MGPPDVLFVSLGSTPGLREADAELVASLRRAGAAVQEVRAAAPREVRTLALTDLAWAHAARRATGGRTRRARSVLYSTTTAALLWERPGAIRFDAPAAGNRPGRHGVWQRPLERRRFAAAPLLVPYALGALAEAPPSPARVVVVPQPVEPSGALVPAADRDVAAVTYAADPRKKGLARVLAAWTAARREGEELVVCGVSEARGRRDVGPGAFPGVRWAGRLPRDEFRALVRRARVLLMAPRREDFGAVQLEALADGTMVVTTAAPGPYAALRVAAALDPRLVGDDLARAVRAALDEPVAEYAERARAALAPWKRAAVDRVVAEELVPSLLGA